MKRIRKFALAMVAVFALSAAPQSASAKVHRVFFLCGGPGLLHAIRL